MKRNICIYQSPRQMPGASLCASGALCKQDTQPFTGFMIAAMDGAEANVPLIGELWHGLFLAGELPDDLLPCARPTNLCKAPDLR